jgi:hypothetical protein
LKADGTSNPYSPVFSPFLNGEKDQIIQRSAVFGIMVDEDGS